MAVVKAKEVERSQELSFENFRKRIPFEALIKENKWLTYNAVYQYMIEERDNTKRLSQESFNNFTILLKDEIYSGQFVSSLASGG